jgi:UDP-glucose 4-epimerase
MAQLVNKAAIMLNRFSRAAVTGGAGFVGSHIVDGLIDEGYDVTIIDDFSSGNLSNLERSMNKVTIVKGDICDRDLVRKALKDIEVVFHEAAIVSVQRSLLEPEVTRHVNIEGTRNVLESCVDCGVRRFIFASSAAVYGNSPVLPLKETATPNPLSPYAATKLQGEVLCKTINESTGLETVVLRYFNIYGKRSTSKSYSGVINAFAERLLANKPLVIYGDGNQSRDFVSVQEIVSANILAARARNISGRVFNVGTGKRTTIKQLAMIESFLLRGSHDVMIDYQPRRDGEVKDSWADITSISTELGFRTRVTLEDGLRQYLMNYPS